MEGNPRMIVHTLLKKDNTAKTKQLFDRQLIQFSYNSDTSAHWQIILNPNLVYKRQFKGVNYTMKYMLPKRQTHERWATL